MGKSISDFSTVTTIGLDLAKQIFQIHAVDAAGTVVATMAIKRQRLISFFSVLPACLIGMEACGSAHYWARELTRMGHQVRLMPPAYVKPYVRRQKNDAADAAAICEAVLRPSMRFVAMRTIKNQAVLMQHKARELLVGQRTQILNALRGHLAEIGLIAPQGANHARALAQRVTLDDAPEKAEGPGIPIAVRAALAPLAGQLAGLDEAIEQCDRAIKDLARQDERVGRLMTIPGFGPLTASAMAATVQDVASFAGPREFAASLGLAPLQRSSGGKERLGRISKMGNQYLRKLLVVGAHAVLFHRKGHDDALRVWADKLMRTKPFNLVAVALANKMARIAFAIMRGQETYTGRLAVALPA